MNASASRAVVSTVHGDLPHIEVTMVMDSTKEKITFDLTLNDTAILIEQLVSSYNAIVPPLRTSRGGFGL